MSPLTAVKYAVLTLFVASVLYVHFRGSVRLKLSRQFLDQSALLAPYNLLVYLFSAVPKDPLLRVDDFPELLEIRRQWTTIRDEALKLFDEGYIRAAVKDNDVGFNSFFKNGWKRFYLTWYGHALPSALKLCPRTVALLQSLPSINGAMFAVLPPGGRLNPHRDPFAGSLRYHLGLVTPNSDACNIVVDGVMYSWRDGEDVLFDETYVHHAENKSDRTRIIIFCDVERPLRTAFMRRINRVVHGWLGSATLTQNVEGERVGAINRAFASVRRLQTQVKRLKTYNRNLYYVAKFALIGGVLYALLA